jgi:hypothetical protein
MRINKPAAAGVFYRQVTVPLTWQKPSFQDGLNTRFEGGAKHLPQFISQEQRRLGVHCSRFHAQHDLLVG